MPSNLDFDERRRSWPHPKTRGYATLTPGWDMAPPQNPGLRYAHPGLGHGPGVTLRSPRAGTWHPFGVLVVAPFGRVIMGVTPQAQRERFLGVGRFSACLQD